MFRCLSNRVAAVALAMAVFAAPSAHASHYFLVDVDFLSPAASEAFTRFGYEDTEVLLRNLLTPDARRAVADATGLADAELVELARVCELLQVRGVGPRAARLLIASGVSGVRDLAGRAPDELLAEVVTENAVGQWTNVDPHLEIVEAWVREACTAPYEVEY